MRVRGYQRYDQAFRDDAVALMERTGRSLREVSADLGVKRTTLHSWYLIAMGKKGKKKAAAVAGPPSTPAEESAEEKLARLERENAVLRKRVDDLEMDRAILKKAAAFFAKESE